ncbi:MAG: DUF1326 domain-containing protein [Gaiellaceae bacterium]
MDGEWSVAGTYVESCNCEAICPCRRIDGAAGGRSTYGICLGALSWLIEDGRAGATDLSGLAVALASRYSDDEEGSPWTFVLYLDERGDTEQTQALEQIFLGRTLGTQIEHFPWAWKASNLVAVRPARIELDHTPGRQWFRVRDVVTVRIAGPVDDEATVTCVIPGHEQQGEELIAERLAVEEEPPLRFEYSGNCGYAARFEYVASR